MLSLCRLPLLSWFMQTSSTPGVSCWTWRHGSCRTRTGSVGKEPPAAAAAPLSPSRKLTNPSSMCLRRRGTWTTGLSPRLSLPQMGCQMQSGGVASSAPSKTAGCPASGWLRPAPPLPTAPLAVRAAVPWRSRTWASLSALRALLQSDLLQPSRHPPSPQ